jgi:ELWxxDGT repeat protein
MLTGACIPIMASEALAQPELLRGVQATAPALNNIATGHQLGEMLIFQIDSGGFFDDGPLFLTDGTAAGTSLIFAKYGVATPLQVASIAGSIDSYVWPGAQLADGTWFFATGIGSLANPISPGGMTIWRSDLRAAGTYAAIAGSSSGNIQQWGLPSERAPLVSTGDAIYWIAPSQSSGTFSSRLFRYDGSTPPQIIDLPGQTVLPAIWESYKALNGRLIFSYRQDPWITSADGTSASRIKDLVGESVKQIATLGDRAYLLTDGFSGGQSGIWSTDGTEAGTVRLANSISIQPMIVSGDRVYFQTRVENNLIAWGSTTGDGTVQLTPGRQLWGTPTTPFRGGFLCTQVPGTPFVHGSTVVNTNITPVPSHLSLSLATSASGDGEVLLYTNMGRLFRTDGTQSGTFAVEMPGGGVITSVSRLVGHAGGKVIFQAMQPGIGTAVFASDGSRFGTTLLTSLSAPWGNSAVYTTDGSVVRWRNSPTITQSAFESEGSNDRSVVTPPGFGIGSLSTFPAPGGVYRVSTIQPNQVVVLWAASMLAEPVEIGRATLTAPNSGTPLDGLLSEDRLVFVLGGQVFGAHHGTGVQLLSNPGVQYRNNLTRLADGSIVVGGSNFLRTKGTPESTTTLSTQGGTLIGALTDDKFVIARNTYIVSAFGAQTGVPENLGAFFWRSFPGGIDRRGAVAGERVVFQGIDEATSGFNRDIELWSTDGTRAGTSRLLDIYAGTVGSDPDSFVTLSGPGGKQAFFFATSPEHGREPWITDGTLSGTRLLRDIAPGPRSSQVRIPYTFTDDYNEDHPVLHVRAEDVGTDRDHVIFYADAPGPTPGTTTGVEPWISDGTPEGTRSLGETFSGVEPGLANLFPRNITSIAGDYLYLTAGSRAGGGLFAVPLGLRERNLCDYDYNRDGNVDSEDAQLMAAVFVGQVPTNPAWFGGDLDASGNADLEDAQRLARYVVTWVCE